MSIISYRERLQKYFSICLNIAVKCYYHLGILLCLGNENEKYLTCVIAGVVSYLLTGENIFINLHSGRWRKIQLQLKTKQDTVTQKSAPEKKETLAFSVNGDGLEGVEESKSNNFDSCSIVSPSGENLGFLRAMFINYGPISRTAREHHFSLFN